MLNFLANSTQPDIVHAANQCSRFCNDPKLSHETALQHIVKYLISTQTDKSAKNRLLTEFNGMIFQPDSSKGIEIFVDVSFIGDFTHSN